MNWIAMSDNVGFFGLQAIVTQILVILTSKMAENGSKLTQKRVCFKKKAKPISKSTSFH